MSNTLWPHESQHARPPCSSPTPRVYSNSCPLGRWCHPTISSSVVPFSSCPQSHPFSLLMCNWGEIVRNGRERKSSRLLMPVNLWGTANIEGGSGRPIFLPSCCMLLAAWPLSVIRTPSLFFECFSRILDITPYVGRGSQSIAGEKNVTFLTRKSICITLW